VAGERIGGFDVKKAALRFGIPIILVAALAGCSKQTSPTSSVVGPGGGIGGGGAGGESAAMTRAAVTATMATTPDIIEDGIAEDGGTMSLDAASGASLASPTAAIRPLSFWRRITDVDRTFEFAFADTDTTGQPTTAMVTVRKKLTGTFNILATSPPPPPAAAVDSLHPPLPLPPPHDSVHVVHKPLDDHWERHLLLKRVPLPGDFDHDTDADESGIRWRVAASSGARVLSAGATTQIQSVRIQTATLDTTITDPLALVRLRRFCRFRGLENVTVTVTTGRNDDIVVLYHRGLRTRFHNNGDNTYTATFRDAWLDGVHHFGVNALSNGTLFDDAAPYDSDAWILPYVIAPTLMADFRP
jgi:hypothetical protein